jgi:hypothetical protein
MSSLAWLIIVVVLLTLAGSLALFLVTVKYYWGERGSPPTTGAARQRQKEQELRLRETQIERMRAEPRKDRKPSFWDNSK